jgi:hypothetical protein
MVSMQEVLDSVSSSKIKTKQQQQQTLPRWSLRIFRKQLPWHRLLPSNLNARREWNNASKILKQKIFSASNSTPKLNQVMIVMIFLENAIPEKCLPNNT